MKKLSALTFLITTLSSGPSHAEFTGPFELSPAGCEDHGECVLTYNFKYKDPKGVEWQAAANNTTDGASIPVWAQPIVGKPFDKMFVRAAVIHDHYCGRHVRPWRQVHRVFYDALIESGVIKSKAKLMYYAVYLGGPKWMKLIAGTTCGDNCTFKYGAGGDFGDDVSEPTYITRNPEYDAPGFADELKKVEKLIDEQGEAIDLEALEKRAQEKRPNDLYYTSGDELVIGSGLQLQ